MNFLKKGTAILLAACLCVLTACGRNKNPTPDTETAMGRYVEERWELPMDANYIPALTIRPDGSIFAIMYGNEEMRGFSTSDGKQWGEDTPSWLTWLLEMDGNLHNLAYGKNGECFFIYGMIVEEHYDYRVARVTHDGAFEDIDLEWEKAAESSGAPSYFFPGAIAVGEHGDLYIDTFFGISRYAPDGRFKALINDSNYPSFTYYDSSLAILDFGSIYGDADTFGLYDTDGGGMTQELNLQALNHVNQGGRIATGPDGALYVANRSGIYRLVPDGTTWERIVDGGLSSLSAPSMSLDSFIPHGDNEFLTLTTEQEKPLLINYVYSAATPTRPIIELTVATLKNNRTLLQAAGEFQRQYPDVLVTVQTLLEDDGSATTADAIRALNTQLLAGKGPDLLLLDGLPIDSYIEKGVLADMSDWLEPVIAGELLANIAGAFREGGKLFAIPARFNMPTIWGRPEAISAASDLASIVEYAENHTERELLYNMDKKSLFRYFADTSANIWLDGRGRLDEGQFAQYLELIGRLADTVPGNAENEEFQMRQSPDFTATGIDTDGVIEASKGQISLYSAELSGISSIQIPNAGISALNGLAVSGENTSIEDRLFPSHIALLPGQESGVFLPSCVIGINADGKQQELAREFIKTVLGESVQDSDLGDGFPVNKASIDKNILRQSYSYMGWSTTDPETGEYWSLDMGWPTEGVFRAVCSLFDRLSTPFMPNDTLMEMILDESEGFFSGSLTASETASAVAERLGLYLAEQG